MTKITVLIFDTKLFADKLQTAVDSTENKRFPSIHMSLAGSDTVFVVPPQYAAVYLMSSKPDSVVIPDTILYEYLREAGSEGAKVEGLVCHWVGDVPAVRVGSVQRAGVLSEPVNVGHTLGIITVSLHRDSLNKVQVE